VRGEADEAVLLHPLQVADPDHHLGQLLGEWVDFDSQKLRGADVGEQADVVGGGEGDHLFFQVEQQVDGDVEEVAGAAGGVEDFDLGEAVQVVAQGIFELFAGGGGLAAWAAFARRLLHLGPERQAFGFGRVPFAPQRGHEHRLQQRENVGAARVVGADLRTLGRVQEAFEQGAEDRRFDVAPILVVDFDCPSP
jgi:hypothetical protein